MKKFSRVLTISILYIAIFSSEIIACSLVAESNLIQDNQLKTFIFLGISVVLFIATVFFYFNRNRKGILPVIIGFLVIGFSFLSSNAYVGDCGYGAVELAQYSILITFLCFTFQFFTWLLKRK